MADSARKLVVRSYAPRRRAALLAAAIAGGCLALYGAFELGRDVAGYDVVAATREAWSASRRIHALERANAQQGAQIAAADVARRVDREGSAQLERNLTDLQGQVARLNQSLAFYRGLVQPDAAVKAKVQQLQIVPAATGHSFELKFMLMQVGKPSGVVSGRIDIGILGRIGERPQRLTLAQVSPRPGKAPTYSFRDFQSFDLPVQLPAEFVPARIGVDLRDAAGRTYRQAFLWRTGGPSAEADAGPGRAGQGELGVQTQEK